MPFREISKNEQSLTGVGVDITEVCNRRCPTCFATHSPRHMSKEVFCKIVDEAVKLEFREFYILGGEPTLHPLLFEFLEYTKGKFNPVILVTNMDRLSDVEFCRKVYKTDVVIAGQRHTLKNDANAEKLEFLLTGGDHLSTSSQAWKNVEMLFPSERVCVQCCITRPVVESGDIFEVFRWCRRNKFEPVMEFTKEGAGFKRSCALDIAADEMLLILQKFREIDEKEFQRKGADMLSPQAYGKVCHMLETSIHFKVDGTSIPCVGHQNISYGHIKSGLDAILQHPLRQVIKNPYEWIYGYCRDECQHFDDCTGGCRGSAFDMTGCPRASFYYCPHIPRERLSLSDMVPPTCKGCILQNHPACNPTKARGI